MKYFKKIEGDRIYLSPVNTDDAEMYVKWLNDFSLTDGIGQSQKVTTITREKQWLEKVQENNEYQFAIVKKDDDTLLGNCGLMDVNFLKQTAELGIFIGEASERNKGYGEEVIKLLIKYGFDYLNLNNIMLIVFSFNESAIKCYKKCGFKEFGRRHNVVTIKNKLYDDIYMEILKEDYYCKNIQ